MDGNFLLENEAAHRLYRDFAEQAPIIDYHCHLDAREIKEDRRYRNMTEIWLSHDHYKWRAMRSNGVKERYITGDADDKEKFYQWARTVPCCIGNPLYHWTHLELRRYFGIEELLSEKTADVIWEKGNALLQEKTFTPRHLLQRSRVVALCTTNDPLSSLRHHTAIAQDETFSVLVLPTFRPDRFFRIEGEEFRSLIEDLAALSGSSLKRYADLREALIGRIDAFHATGCRLADHALESVDYRRTTERELSATLVKGIAGDPLTKDEVTGFRTELLLSLGEVYAQRGWVMQLHIGAMRDTHSRMLTQLGPDTGFDSMSDTPFAESLAKTLDALEKNKALPKTVLYCLNPKDNAVLASLIGCFQGEEPGKMQLGPAWWFNDHKEGLERQMKALGHLGLLSRFIGMVTDSRSFLSYARHEYFRRILCRLVGQWVADGECPDDRALLGPLIEGICFRNARDYLGLGSQLPLHRKPSCRR